MANKIEVDISSLSSTLSDLRDLASKANSDLEEMVAALESLNGTWAGAAHDVFMQVYDTDQDTMQQALETLDKFLDSVNYARDEYSKCEQDVGQIVSGISV